jgi:hypothetical protein
MPAASALASSTMVPNPEYQRANETVATYHETCLRELLAHVADALDRYRAGDIDAFDVDEIIHHHHRGAAELWKFCSAGGGSHVRSAARLVEDNAASGEVIEWWDRGAPRGR